jgi:tetratricopeptide (TPR) repeat protein
VGPCILVALLITKQVEGKHAGNNARHSTVALVTSALLVLLAARTVQRNYDWQSEADLFKSGASVNPTNAKLHWGVASALQKSGDLDDAAASCAVALQLDPTYKDVHNGLGVILSEQGATKEAESHYRIALQLDPVSTEVFCNLGKLLHSTRANEAADAYQQAITLISNTRYVRLDIDCRDWIRVVLRVGSCGPRLCRESYYHCIVPLYSITVSYHCIASLYRTTV